MRKKCRLCFFCLTGLLVASFLSSIQNPVYGEGNLDPKTNKPQNLQSIEERMNATLEDAAEALGGGFGPYNDINHYLLREKQVGTAYGNPAIKSDILSITVNYSYDCASAPWESYTFHGMEGCVLKWGDDIYSVVWNSQADYSKDGTLFNFYVASFIDYCGGSGGSEADDEELGFCEKNYGIRLAEALHQAAIKNGLYEPITDESLPVETEQVVIVEENTQPEVVIVPYGDETEAPTEPEQEVIVVPYGETSPEDTLAESGSFDETWQSAAAKAVRSPLIPIAGGVIGAGLAWLFAQGASQVTNSAASIPTPVYAPPQGAPPELAQTPPVYSTEPPMLVTEPPPIQMETPSVKSVAPTNPYDLAFNLVKDTVGTAGTLTGITEKFLTNPNSLKTANIIKDVVNKLAQTPATEATVEYVADFAKVRAAEKIGKASKLLGVAGKFLDTAEALKKAEKICSERGYRGMDAVMRTYAEVGKKGAVWLLTDNPVVGLADAAMGGATSMLFGSDYKVDISAVVEKTDYAWDNVTRHAGDKYYSRIETNAADESKENLRNLTQRISQQVRSGQLDKQEGARRLRKVLDKFNQESPLL